MFIPSCRLWNTVLTSYKSDAKEMLPVLTTPLIQYGVEEAIEAGCDIMSVITGRGKRAITDHFDISYELEHQIKGSSKEEQKALQAIKKERNRIGYYTLPSQDISSILIVSLPILKLLSISVNGMYNSGVKVQVNINVTVLFMWG